MAENPPFPGGEFLYPIPEETVVAIPTKLQGTRNILEARFVPLIHAPISLSSEFFETPRQPTATMISRNFPEERRLEENTSLPPSASNLFESSIGAAENETNTIACLSPPPSLSFFLPFFLSVKKKPFPFVLANSKQYREQYLVEKPFTKGYVYKRSLPLIFVKEERLLSTGNVVARIFTSRVSSPVLSRF